MKLTKTEKVISLKNSYDLNHKYYQDRSIFQIKPRFGTNTFA